MTSTQKKQSDLPKYHSTNDDFINDPDSMKFQFTSPEDIRENSLRHAIDCLELFDCDSHSKKKSRSIRMQLRNTKNPTRERPIPKKKKKKYQTKPKDHSKIYKLKASRTNAPAC